MSNRSRTVRHPRHSKASRAQRLRRAHEKQNQIRDTNQQNTERFVVCGREKKKMPITSRVPSMVDLCLKNIATNVLWHGKNFMEVQQGSKIYIQYRIVQFLFSHAILKQIEDIFRNKEVASDDCLTRFAELLFEGKVNKDCWDHLWPSLQFLFNEFTSHVSLRLNFFREPWVANETFRALFSCKNLKSLRLQSCSFYDGDVLNVMRNNNSLTEVDLLYGTSCSDMTIIDMLKKCPSLRSFKASGQDITDKSLLSLCANNEDLRKFRYCQTFGQCCSLSKCSNSVPPPAFSVCRCYINCCKSGICVDNGDLQKFRFCRNSGRCCNLGKSLIELKLYETKITKAGIACALQHLPRLQAFVDGGLTLPSTDLDHRLQMKHFSDDIHFVPQGISELHDAYMLDSGYPPTLKLTSLVFDDYSWRLYSEKIKRCCPQLDAFTCCLGPLRTLCVDPNYELIPLQSTRTRACLVPFTCMGNILLCLSQNNIRAFYTDGRPVYVSDGGMDLPAVPASVWNLEKIHIYPLKAVSPLSLRFLSNVLSQAYSVRFLTVSGIVAEECFTDAVKVNAFRKLEEITFWYADLRNISVKHLTGNGYNLKKITHMNCSNAETFTNDHKEFCRQNNFYVDISEEPDERYCYATIKYS